MRRDLLLLFIILLAAFFLRLWRFPELFYATIDEEAIGLIGWRMVELERPPLATMPLQAGLRFPPFFTIATGIMLLIGQFDLRVIGLLSILASLGTIILCWYAGRVIAGRRVAFLTAILMAFSFLLILFDRRGWPIAFHPFLASLTLVSLLKISQGRRAWWVPLFVASWVAIQMEPVGLLIPLFATIGVLLKPSIISRRIVLINLALLAVTLMPLAAFEFRHNFPVLKSVGSFLMDRGGATYYTPTEIPSLMTGLPVFPFAFVRLLIPFEPYDVSFQHSFFPPHIGKKFNAIPTILWILPALVVFTIGRRLIYDRRDQSIQSHGIRLLSVYTIAVLLFALAFVMSFGGQIFEHHTVILFPAFFLFAGISLDHIAKKLHRLLLPFLVLILVLFNGRAILSLTSAYPFKDKLHAVSFIKEHVRGDPYELVNPSQSAWTSGGYRYLLTVAGIPPTRSYMDPFLAEYYISLPKNDPVQWRVVLLTPELFGGSPAILTPAQNIELLPTSEAQFGNITVRIFRENLTHF